ncbi:MAG: Uncharacterized protein JWP55_1243 [Mycobacterium sp.]|nr:Uncharacterized protein [Mycobacterium sp.]
MSKASAAKRARRKRRLVARNERWLPDEVHADVEGVALIAGEIIARGWEFDREFSTENFITWFYPPSGVEVDDESVEPVTRIWLSEPDEPHVILVGSGEADGDYQFTVEQLFARLDEIEAYRIGNPLPAVN